ncbi:hypothetical protein FA10DRAFT_265035 [Acaromyces ingoldii]|uniref:DUF1275 domain protein n=1 Tax=Acaromyces ingoldii TaxID=215250 RepID=A0A316YQ59_9BASI|nr:hypothetical protein FA10DRAFT_265035 [Acaromyces ingoldii]PWN91156.1 hypothetical protein FA10DRAFT_265035 [Acaromyces ingoldii]
MGDTNPTAIPAAPVYAGKESNEGKAPEAGEAGDEGRRSRSKIKDAFQSRLAHVVSHEEATIPLAWQALNTGLVDALIYSKSQIWTGFQTGNMVQFSQNVAQYMLPGVERYPLLTLERALSVISFILGSFVGALGGRRWGDRNRSWLIASSLLQSFALFGAAGILLSRPEDEAPSFTYWPGTIVLVAFSMGMQSIAAQKLVSPAFATTVAFTATLTQIASDPYLFFLTLSPIEKHRAKRQLQQSTALEDGPSSNPPPPKKPTIRTLGRDRRLLGIFALCTGAGVAEMLLQSHAGVRGGLAIAAGFKLVQSLLWLVPSGE